MALHDILVRVGADTEGFTSGLSRATQVLGGWAGAAVNAIDMVALSMRNVEGEQLSRVQRMQNEYVAFGARTTGVLAGITSAFAAVTVSSSVGIGLLVNQAAKFEHAFADVRKTTDATEEQFTELSRAIREMSLTMPESAVEITRVAAVAGQLGVEVENIERFTEVMIQLGVATENLSAEEAATSLARLMNIMGTSYDDVDRLGSTLVDLGNNLATTEREIVNLAMRLAGAGAQVNMSEADVLSFAGALSSLGLRTEMAGTAFSRVILNMNTAVMEGGKELEIFARVAGMTVDEFSQAFREDASSAIVAFISGLGDMSAEGKNTVGVLNDLNLGELRVRDTLLRTSEASDLLAEALDRGRNAWAENTALQEEYEEKSSTLIARLQILRNHFQYVAQVVGVVLMDALQPVIGAIEWFVGVLVEWAQKLEDASEGTKKLVGWIILAVPILTGLITVILGVATAASALYTAFTTLAIAIGTTAGKLAIVTAGIVPLIAIVGALTVAVGYAGKAFVDWLKGTDEDTKRMREETDELVNSTKDLTESTFKSAAAFAESQQRMQETQGETNALVSQLDKLAEKEDKSIGDKALLMSIVDDLNSSVADLNLTYDEQADSLSMSNKEIQARVDLMHEEERAIAAQQRLAEIQQERIDLEMQLEETIALREEWQQKVEEGGLAIADERARVMELTESEEELRRALETLGVQYEATEGIVEEATENMTRIVEENNLDQIQSYEDLEGEMKETFDRMVENYRNLEEAATNAFDRINTESEHSLAEMVENMEHNRKATEEWGKNRAELMEWASKEGHIGFMKWVDQLGIDHAGELAEMAKALDGSSAEQLKLLEELAEGYDKNAETAADAFKENLGDGFDEAVDMMVEFVNDSSKTMRSEMFDAGFHEIGAIAPKEMSDGIDDSADEVYGSMRNVKDKSVAEFDDLGIRFTTIGGYAMSGLKRGINNNESSVMASANRIAGRITQTFERALQIRSPSRVLMRIGQFVGEGLVVGMESELRNIERMAEKVAEAATPETPKIAGLDVGEFEATAREMSASISTNVAYQDRELVGILSDVRDELRAQSEELRKQKETIIQLDRKEIGRSITPIVDEELGYERNRRATAWGGRSV